MGSMGFMGSLSHLTRARVVISRQGKREIICSQAWERLKHPMNPMDPMKPAHSSSATVHGRSSGTTMFVRFRQSRRSLQLSLIETRRVEGKVRHEHIVRPRKRRDAAVHCRSPGVLGPAA
jgi:hypothetical protein